MMGEREEETGGVGRFTMLLIGVGIGALIGVLYAPKAGVETREDLADFRRRNRGKVRDILSSINEKIPGRVKAAAAYGAIKEGASEAGREAKQKVNEAFS